MAHSISQRTQRITGDILPCPFCGSSDLFLMCNADKELEAMSVMCISCETYGPTHAVVKGAIFAWNKRYKYADAGEDTGE